MPCMSFSILWHTLPRGQTDNNKNFSNSSSPSQKFVELKVEDIGTHSQVCGMRVAGRASSRQFQAAEYTRTENKHLTTEPEPNHPRLWELELE